MSTELKDCRFKLEPELFSTKVSVKEFEGSKKKNPFQCRMKQIPANTNDASTGHKLQGMSKDVIIVTSWPTGFKNWEYVVLSHACILSGLYLVEPINMNKSYQICKIARIKLVEKTRGCNVCDYLALNILNIHTYVPNVALNIVHIHTIHTYVPNVALNIVHIHTYVHT